MAIEVYSGDLLELILPCNPTTGYQWVLDESFKHIIEILEKDYIGFTSHDKIGSGGKCVLILNLKLCHSETIYFQYQQPWEGNKSSADEFFLTLNIIE